MKKIELPTRIGLIPIRVKKIKRTEAVLEVESDGAEFDIPLEILPESAREGDRLSLKIMDGRTVEENHTTFAQRLLEEIIN